MADCPNNEGVVAVVVKVAGAAWLPNILAGLLFPNNGLVPVVLPNEPPAACAEVAIVLPKRPVAGCCGAVVLPLAPPGVVVPLNKLPPAGCWALVFPNRDPVVPPNIGPPAGCCVAVPPNRPPPACGAAVVVGTFPNNDPLVGCCCCCCVPTFPNKLPPVGCVLPDVGCCCEFAVLPKRPPAAGCCCWVLVFPNKLPPLGLEVFPKIPPGVVVEFIELVAGAPAPKREVPVCDVFCWGFGVLVPPNRVVVPGWL